MADRKQARGHVFPFRWRVTIECGAAVALLALAVCIFMQALQYSELAQASTPGPQGLVDGTMTLSDYPGVMLLYYTVVGLLTGAVCIAVCWHAINDEPSEDDAELSRDFRPTRALREMASDALADCRAASAAVTGHNAAGTSGSTAEGARELAAALLCALGMCAGTVLLVVGLAVGWFGDSEHIWQFALLLVIISMSMLDFSRM